MIPRWLITRYTDSLSPGRALLLYMHRYIIVLHLGLIVVVLLLVLPVGGVG